MKKLEPRGGSESWGTFISLLVVIKGLEQQNSSTTSFHSLINIFIYQAQCQTFGSLACWRKNNGENNPSRPASGRLFSLWRKTKYSETPASHLRGSSRWSWCAGRACRWRSARGDLSLSADSGTRSPDWAWPWWAAAGRWCPARRRPTGAPTPEQDWSLCTGSVLPSSEPLRTRGKKKRHFTFRLLFGLMSSTVHSIHLWSFKIKVHKSKFYCCFFGVFPSKQLSKFMRWTKQTDRNLCS